MSNDSPARTQERYAPQDLILGSMLAPFSFDYSSVTTNVVFEHTVRLGKGPPEEYAKLLELLARALGTGRQPTYV
jgi:hypothetical protein